MNLQMTFLKKFCMHINSRYHWINPWIPGHSINRFRCMSLSRNSLQTRQLLCLLSQGLRLPHLPGSTLTGRRGSSSELLLWKRPSSPCLHFNRAISAAGSCHLPPCKHPTLSTRSPVLLQRSFYNVVCTITIHTSSRSSTGVCSEESHACKAMGDMYRQHH